MAYLLTGERPDAVAFSSPFLAGIAGWLGKVRNQRARKVALSDLLEYEDYRLEDLGLSRHDILEAIRHPAPASPTLTARRAARATAFRSNAISTSLFEAGGTY